MNNPALTSRPLALADYALAASGFALSAAIALAAWLRTPVSLIFVLAGVALIHVTWCWALASGYYLPARRVFWAAWIPIGLTLGIGSLINGLIFLAILNIIGNNPGLESFLTLFGFFTILSVAILPPFVLYKRRADHALFWLAMFQLPMALVAILYFCLMDQIVLTQPDPMGFTDLVTPAVFGSMFPCLPTLIALSILKARRLYGTTPISNACQKCGYDLTGTLAAKHSTCPECGTAISTYGKPNG